MSSLVGRRILVVGASAGVGRAFAVRAVAAGAEVVLSARRPDRLADAIEAAGGGTPVVGDVRQEADCRRLVEQAVDHIGPLDLLFYAAGFAPLRALIETDSADWREVLETNVIGLQQVLAAAVPRMTDGGIAAVLSSETVGRPRSGLGAYGASKAALAESLRAWRLEHPEVRFACLALGATQPTEFGDRFDPRLLGPVLDDWVRQGLIQEAYMHTDEVAGLLADLLGSALEFPGVGIEDLVLRSPSRVIGTESAFPALPDERR
jgi:NAD(P)-dependent dehydrogenase (short-subunit alcohol dehydrogenase family)